MPPLRHLTFYFFAQNECRYTHLSGAWSTLLYFAAFVVQQTQPAPKPTAGVSYGSLVRRIWRLFLFGDNGASESFVSQLLEMFFLPDEALLWLIFLPPYPVLSHTRPFFAKQTLFLF